MKQENNIHFESFYDIGVWKTRVTDIDLDDLIEKSYQAKNEVPSVAKSNKGGYQSEGNLHTNPLFFPLIKPLNDIHSQITNNPNSKIDSMWLNISSYKDFNNIHNHGKELFQLSGVIYLKTPKNSGRIHFCHPMEINLGFPYQPIEGDLLIFPQMLPHIVEPNLNKEDRISIAFNFEK
tara:strand:- start:22 stop:555 length:534 start_codon:yes stop_codon:yes gene_type:complete